MADQGGDVSTQALGNNDGSCCYIGMDSFTQVGSNDDNTWFSICNCKTTTLESGTYDEAVQALLDHRALSGC